MGERSRERRASTSLSVATAGDSSQNALEATLVSSSRAAPLLAALWGSDSAFDSCQSTTSPRTVLGNCNLP